MKPFILILNKCDSFDLNEEIKKKCDSLYQILFDNNIINIDTIIVFCIIKEYNNKKTFFYQAGKDSNKDILEKLNLKLLELLTFNFIKNFSTKYTLEFNNKIIIKEKQENLSFLCNLWINI